MVDVQQQKRKGVEDTTVVFKLQMAPHHHGHRREAGHIAWTALVPAPMVYGASL